jgi:hypothetical protein
MAHLDRDDLVVLIGAEGRWRKVRLPGGVPCYVHSSLVRRDPDGTAVVKATRVLVRPTPGKKLLPLETVLDRGEVLHVLGEEGDWLRVVSPDRLYVYVFDELVRELGPVSEYRRALERAARERLAELRGASPEAARAREAEKQKELRKAALEAGDQVLEGGGETDALVRTLRRVTLESDDDLTRGYANALLALLDLRRRSEELRRDLERAAENEREKVEELEKSLAQAEERYRGALEKARVLRALREAKFRGVGKVVKQGEGFLLVEGGRTLFRLTSKRFRLEDFVGKRVGVNGRMVVVDKKTGATHLMVELIEIMPAGNR